MAKSTKNVLSYRPSESDVKHARHCISLNLINISLSRVADYKDEYHLVRYDDSVPPAKLSYFLKDFSIPATPANRKVFTEFEAYKKLYEIYREFYMRNMNLTEDEITKDKQEVMEKEIKETEKKSVVKKTKKESKEEAMLNFPHKQINLLDMIEDCEKENRDNGM